MSLALHLAADAQADLRQLDPWLQEEILDELERLASEPGLVPPPLPGWGSVHAFAPRAPSFTSSRQSGSHLDVRSGSPDYFG